MNARPLHAAEHHSAQAADAAIATDAEIALWNKEVVPFARDLLFVLGVFGYLIGFANHSAKMAQFGMETQLADQPLTSLFTWAAEAISLGWPGYVFIFAVVGFLLLLAGFLKHRFAAKAICRPIVYALVTLAICSGIVLSFVWSAKVGVCDARRNWAGDKKLAAVLMRVDSRVNIPALAGKTPSPAFILSETNDAYQVLVVQPAPDISIPMMVPRADVLSVEFSTPVADDTSQSPPLANNRVPGPPGVPTPAATQSGADGQAAAATSDSRASARWCYSGLDS